MNDRNDFPEWYFAAAVAVILALLFFYIVGKGMIAVFGGGA